MKKIEAIIRPENFEGVKQALNELGYPGMTISDVKGHGKQRGLEQSWRGKPYRIEFIPKLKIEIVVIDEDLPKLLNAIIREARTESIGDGKIFIYDVADAIRIRTGEYGDNAI